jgi:excisionase family DNA binding protein
MFHMSIPETGHTRKPAASMRRKNYESNEDTQMMKTDKLLYSRKEAAQLLGISSVTLWRMVRRGELKPRHIGDRPMFSRTELARFAGATA